MPGIAYGEHLIKMQMGAQLTRSKWAFAEQILVNFLNKHWLHDTTMKNVLSKGQNLEKNGFLNTHAKCFNSVKWINN